MQKAIELIEDALQSAESHPLFMGYQNEGIDDLDVEQEGGDAAFVTADIAWRLQEALNILRGLITQN